MPMVVKCKGELARPRQLRMMFEPKECPMNLKSYIAGLSLALLAHAPSLHAYGGGSSGSGGCPEPKFYDESPAKNTAVQALSEFSITASDNTDVATLNMEINGRKVEPGITTLRSGEQRLHVRLPEALTQAGKVRVTLAAKSKEGCSAFHPVYLEIKP
jgi:hypothetical protein